jgi:hypothetical protein
MMNSYFFPYYFYPRIPHMNEKPPTIYSLLESIVNFGTDDKTKIKDLAKHGRSTFFNFDYELSQNITKEKFETTILNHYLMRRIGFDTLTAFRIQLNVKINEIMPLYNKMFDSLQNWNILEDGRTITKTGTNVDNNSKSNTTNNSSSNTTNNTLANTSSNNTNNTSDRRESDTPQNQLSDIRDGKYVTKYNYDTNTTTSQDTSNSTGSSTSSTTGQTTSSETDNKQNAYNETIVETAGNKIEIYKQLQQDINNILTMIFKDLDCLFYGLV